MLKARVIFVCAVILGLASASKAEVFTSPAGFIGPDQVITFETGSTALPRVPGVTLTPYGDALADFETFLFGSQVYSNTSGSSGCSDLYAKFSPVVTEVGAWGRLFQWGGGPSQLTVNVYGPSNNLLETAILPMNNKTPSFLGFRELQGISKIEWLGGNHGFFALDNITYGSPAPEPATAGYLAFALLVAAGRRRLRAV